MKPERDKRLETACANSGEGSLKAAVLNLAPGEGFRVFKRTYFGPEDFYDNRYDSAFSPILNDNGYSQLASRPLSTPCGQTRRLTVEARGDEIRVLEGGELLLSARDGAYRTGCVGLGVYGGCRAYFDDLAIEPPD